MLEEKTGIVFNIQHFSIHDGPGIRDVVFLKGCPLRCQWCSNPESQLPAPQIAYNARKCLGSKVCGACIQACGQGALHPSEDGRILRNWRLCTQCGACAAACPSQAMHVFGQEMTVAQVMEQTIGRLQGWRSNGGITVSGGEPLAQASFVAELLSSCRAIGTHTAMETCGCAPWEAMELVAPHCDLIFMDIKFRSPELHRRWTGGDNNDILKNLRQLSQNFPGVELIVRTPLIPGINDMPEELEGIVDLLRGLPNLSDYELLPYHAFGSNKYEELGRPYQLSDVPAPNKAAVLARNNELRSALGLEPRTE